MGTEWDWARRDLADPDEELVIVKGIGGKQEHSGRCNTMSIGGILVLEKDIKRATCQWFTATQVKNSNEAMFC